MNAPREMTRLEAFELAWPVLRKMIEDENPLNIAYAASIWSSATDEQVAAIAFLADLPNPLTDGVISELRGEEP